MFIMNLFTNWSIFLKFFLNLNFSFTVMVNVKQFPLHKNRYSAVVIDFPKYPFVATCTFKLFRLSPIKFLGDVFRRSSQQSFVNSYMAKNLFSHDPKK